MVMTDISLSGTAALLTGSTTLIPRFCAIGTGSMAESASVGSLATEALSERRNFSSRDDTTQRQVTWTFDYGAVEMSGTSLSEFGVASGSTIEVQDLWNIEEFASSEFDGSNELQVQVTYQYFL